jgi:hypothetical protein
MKGPSKAEIKRAREWRIGNFKSVDDLAELSGWSREAIYIFERTGGSPRAWQRYRLACAAIAGGDAFEWDWR